MRWYEIVGETVVAFLLVFGGAFIIGFASTVPQLVEGNMIELTQGIADTLLKAAADYVEGGGK